MRQLSGAAPGSFAHCWVPACPASQACFATLYSPELDGVLSSRDGRSLVSEEEQALAEEEVGGWEAGIGENGILSVS